MRGLGTLLLSASKGVWILHRSFYAAHCIRKGTKAGKKQNKFKIQGVEAYGMQEGDNINIKRIIRR